MTLVLTALAAIQLPWFSCRSDCHDALLPVWELGVHRCHDEGAHRPTARACACPCDDAPTAYGTTIDGDRGHDHEPGNHELLVQASRRPAPSPPSTPDLLPTFALLGALVEVGSAHEVAVRCDAVARLETGPPERLTGVRLLL